MEWRDAAGDFLGVFLNVGFETGPGSLKCGRFHSAFAVFVLILEGVVEEDDVAEDPRAVELSSQVFLLERPLQRVVPRSHL